MNQLKQLDIERTWMLRMWASQESRMVRSELFKQARIALDLVRKSVVN